MSAITYRIYLVFLSDKLGGDAGLASIRETLFKILEYRQIEQPRSVSTLLVQTEAAPACESNYAAEQKARCL